jgi:4-hydroxythreonine-4-phosphate dehydrogenase
MTAPRPRIGLSLGDRNGIGPEIAARLLVDPTVRSSADILLVADPAVLAHGRQVAGVGASGPLELVTRTPCPDEPIGTGRGSAAAGSQMLSHLAALVELARAGDIGGFVFAPLNKAAMRAGGLAHGDELDFITGHLGFSGPCGELNVLGALWTSRVTSHIPLREVADCITEAGVLAAIELADRMLRAQGREAPRLAVAGLNPHAGDGGAFGDEEIRVIGPAIARARAAGIAATGPHPPDTVFVTARAENYDAVVSMFHDQGQIAMKLLGFAKGVTVLGGLPFPVTTVAHGTAYDIVGRGVARADALLEAFRLCRTMVLAKECTRPWIKGENDAG